MDLHFTQEGDIAVSGSGDVALTQTQFRDTMQQAYIRMLTDAGDFLLYPTLGATLSDLIGRPQSPATGQYGVELIEAALNREGFFTGKPFAVKAVPTGPTTLRFDISILNGSGEQVTLSVEQQL